MLNIFALIDQGRVKKLLSKSEKLFAEKNYLNARYLTKQALDIDKHNSYALYLLSKNEYFYGQKIENRFSKSNFEDAYQYIEEAIELEKETEPENRELENLLAYYLLKIEIMQSLKYHSSFLIETYEKILEINPEYLDILVKLTDYKIKTKERRKALALIEKIVNISLNKEKILVDYADKLHEQGLTPEAIECYRQLIQIEPRAEFYLQKGIYHSLIQQNEKALINLDRAIEIEPELGSAWLHKAMALCQSSEYAKAEESLSRVKVENLFQEKKHIYWYTCAVVSNQLNKNEVADSAIQNALSFEPENLILLETRAIILEAMGLFSEARLVYGQIKKTKPTSSILQKEALLCLRTKEYDDSFELFNQVFDSFFKYHNEELESISKRISFFFKQPKKDKVAEADAESMKDWAGHYLHALLRTIYEQEEASEETINRLWEVCQKNLRKLENNSNYALKANVYFMNINNFQKNIHWINILKRTFGKNDFGRNGIYFLEQSLAYWETDDDDILSMLSESEKEIIDSI